MGEIVMETKVNLVERDPDLPFRGWVNNGAVGRATGQTSLFADR
jgi:hypothetical protein